MLYPPRHAASPRAEDLELGGPAPVADGGQAHLIDLHAQGDQHDPGLSREPWSTSSEQMFAAAAAGRCGEADLGLSASSTIVSRSAGQHVAAAGSDRAAALSVPRVSVRS